MSKISDYQAKSKIADAARPEWYCVNACCTAFVTAQGDLFVNSVPGHAIRAAHLPAFVAWLNDITAEEGA